MVELNINFMANFVISDTHFGHKNMASLRGMSVDFMDKLLVDNWNSVVKKNDKVYHLGDVSMCSKAHLSDILSSLNGNMIVIGGNHDTRDVVKTLNSFNIPVVGSYSYNGLLLTHIPVMLGMLDLYDHYSCNVHGHIHAINSGTSVKMFGDKYYNVNVEFHDYTPVDLDALVKMCGTASGD